jgi:DNA-binding cell septation regulator SpoVG
MGNAKPAGDNGGHRDREITVADWKPLTKNTLRGFFTATLPSGMVIHNLTVHEKNGSRWIGLPAREWTDAGGTKNFAKLIEFTDRRTADRFRDALLLALDKHLEASCN